MPEISRRTFLARGSMGVAIAGAAVAIPGLPALLSATETAAPAVEDAGAAAAEDGVVPTLTEPLVAQITDARTGQFSLFMGDREVIYHDPAMAARMLNAVNK
jgi:hypothetical protein